MQITSKKLESNKGMEQKFVLMSLHIPHEAAKWNKCGI